MDKKLGDDRVIIHGSVRDIENGKVKRYYLKEILLLLVSILLILLLLEGIFQKQAVFERLERHGDNLDFERCIRSSKTPGLVYEYVGGECNSNSWGYKNKEYNINKDPGTFRIIVIGDSVAEGLYENKFNNSFGNVLENELNKDFSKERFEVYNLARAGYSTHQELVLLEKEAFTYNPDLIIWSYVLNDPAHPLYRPAFGYDDYFVEPKSHFLHFLSKKLFFLNEKIKSRNCPKEYHEFLHCVNSKEIEKNIEQIGKITRKNEVDVIFLIHPLFHDNIQEITSIPPIHEQMSGLATDQGFFVVDLLDLFKDFKRDEVQNKPESGFDPIHPNIEGERIIGKYISEKINEFNII
jgi:lysophospholipase L1-like esterase